VNDNPPYEPYPPSVYRVLELAQKCTRLIDLTPDEKIEDGLNLCVGLFMTHIVEPNPGEPPWYIRLVLTESGKDIWEAAGEDEKPPPKAKPNPYRKKDINKRMAEHILEDAECHGWTCSQWSGYLKCSNASVVATNAWKTLEMTREQRKAERAKDRRHRSKGSEQRRAAGQDLA